MHTSDGSASQAQARWQKRFKQKPQGTWHFACSKFVSLYTFVHSSVPVTFCLPGEAGDSISERSVFASRWFDNRYIVASLHDPLPSAFGGFVFCLCSKRSVYCAQHSCLCFYREESRSIRTFQYDGCQYLAATPQPRRTRCIGQRSLQP